MNQQNLNYLKDNLKYLGFGDKLYPELEKNIQQRFPEFVLKMDTEINKEPMTATLHFRRPEQGDMYFFNSYRAELNKSGDPVGQTFYVNKGQGVTLKEAYNLLSGRAVNKDLTNAEGSKYNAWLQIHFNERDNNGNYKMKQYHQNYGYDLENTLAKYPIKELSNEQQKEMLIKSLEKGNAQSVFLEQNGSVEKVIIAANPQFKTLDFSDLNGKTIKQSELEEKFPKQEILGVATKEESSLISNGKSMNGDKNDLAADGTKSNLQQETTQDKKAGIQQEKQPGDTNKKSNLKSTKAESLLPKKRTSNKKSIRLA